MKKIKRFIINETSCKLTPEEMRHIIGGSTGGCKTDQCYAYVYVNGKLEATHSGNCGEDDSINRCVCKTSAGNYYDDKHECG